MSTDILNYEHREELREASREKRDVSREITSRLCDNISQDGANLYSRCADTKSVRCDLALRQYRATCCDAFSVAHQLTKSDRKHVFAIMDNWNTAYAKFSR